MADLARRRRQRTACPTSSGRTWGTGSSATSPPRAARGGGNRSTFTAVWLDADDDGWPDLYVINEFGNGVLLVNQHDGTFRRAGPGRRPRATSARWGSRAGDFDNDGHIDLYAANMYSKAGNRVIGNLWPGTYPEPIMAKMRSFIHRQPVAPQPRRA